MAQWYEKDSRKYTAKHLRQIHMNDEIETRIDLKLHSNQTAD